MKKTPRTKRLVIIGCIVLILLLLLLFNVHFKTEKESYIVSETEPFESDLHVEEEKQVGVSKRVVVDIKGAVVHQGVYELEEGQRVKDAIQMAGGFTENADVMMVNLASIVRDESVIYVPEIGDEERVNIATLYSNGQSTGSDLVLINTATIDELQTLPGIGPSKAAAIKSHIEENGPLKTIEDLTNVSGIGPKTLEKLKDKIEVR